MKRPLSVVLSLALVVTALAYAPAVALSWQDKVDASVLQAASSGPTGFIVHLEARADLSAADALSTKAAKGWFVYDALTTTARQSQAPLVARIEAAGAPFTQFWVANAILVTGGLDLIGSLASRPDVRAIYGVGSGGLDKPVDVPTGPTSVSATSTVGPSVAHVRADQAWALGYRGQGAVVAGADTGVQWTHSALKTHYRGWDAATGTASHDYNWHNAAGPNVACAADESQPCDDDDHGTHTMGTIVGDDGAGNQVGMAPDAKWIACRNMNNGLGVVPTYMDCMQWLIAPTRLDGTGADPSKAPDVVSNSWACVEVCAPPLLKDMVDASRAAGIVYVVAAGNNNQFLLGLTTACNTIVEPPAVYHSSFTVGATGTSSDGIASFSSLGPVNDNPIEGVGYRKPDIVAPGVGIRSALASSDTAYGNKSGTSMAAPHVAGLVALIISANPSLRGHVDTIEDIITSTAQPLTSAKGCGGDTSTQVPNNVFGWGRIDALAAVQKALVTQPTEPASQQLVGLTANLVSVTKETSTQTHPTTDHGSGTALSGTTTWRVVKDTGNCCENHLGATSGGRLFDIGGSFVNYTDDLGLTWTSVRPPEPLVNGEGSIITAPNGDVLGITWDAYTGDHLVAYKYNADSGHWLTLTNVIKQPFDDRPWISVIPGPFTDATGKVVPYIAVAQGGGVLDDPMFVSTDGLVYGEPSSLLLGELNSSPISDWFPISPNAAADWIQPIRASAVTPFGAGHAGHTAGYLLDPDTREWHPWTLPGGGDPPSFIQVDSAGRIHEIASAGGSTMRYRISADGGRTWTSETFPVSLAAAESRLIDFKVNRGVGIAAVAARVNAQDWVYKFDITGATPRLLRVHRVGLGDNPAGSNIGALTNPRMDFQTIVILPDGRVATSFLDSTTFSHPPGTGMLGRITPALAIELDSTFEPPPTPTPTPTPVPADLLVDAMTAGEQKPKAGDPVLISATITNGGASPAGASTTRFALDDGTVLGDVDTPAIAAGSSVTVSVGWDTRGRHGTHVVTATADAAGLVAETNEANNTGTLTLTVRGNKVQNQSFESSNASGSAPENWEGSSTGAGSTGYESEPSSASDGSRSVSIYGTGQSAAIHGSPSWQSAPFTVTPGETLTVSVDAKSVGLSSAPTLSLAYLGPAGELLSTVSVLTAPLTTSGFVSLSSQLQVPPEVGSMRLVLTGFSPTDTATRGMVVFDDVGVWGE